MISNEGKYRRDQRLIHRPVANDINTKYEVNSSQSKKSELRERKKIIE